MVKKTSKPTEKPAATKQSKKISKGTVPAVTKTDKKTKLAEPKRILDLCLLMDCTSSMQVWIERSKDTLKDIINNIKASNPELDVRVGFVGYRDIKDDERFCVHGFTNEIETIK